MSGKVIPLGPRAVVKAFNELIKAGPRVAKALAQVDAEFEFALNHSNRWKQIRTELIEAGFTVAMDHDERPSGLHLCLFLEAGEDRAAFAIEDPSKHWGCNGGTLIAWRPLPEFLNLPTIRFN